MTENEITIVLKNLLNSVVAAALALVLLGCGGSSNPSLPDNTGQTDVATQTVDELGDANDSDGETDASQVQDNTTELTTPEVITQSDQPDSISVSTGICEPISTDVTYETTDSELSSKYGVYLPMGAPGIYGWDGTQFCDAISSTDVEPISLMIPFVRDAPDLNNYTPERFTRNLQTFTNQGYQDQARAGDFHVQHDGEFLYVWFIARNEKPTQLYTDSSDISDDDSLEIFIDGNNSKGDSYDGTDDYHTLLAFDDSFFTAAKGSNSADGLDITYNAYFDDYYCSSYYKARINLASAGIKVGVPFGFDIQLNEDDNGGAGDAKFSWFEPTGSHSAASKPSVLATVVLTGCLDPNNCGLDQSLTGQ